jgi:hypothetical protein
MLVEVLWNQKYTEVKQNKLMFLERELFAAGIPICYICACCDLCCDLCCSVVGYKSVSAHTGAKRL